VATLFPPAEPAVWHRLTLILVFTGSACLVCADTVVPGLVSVTGQITPTAASTVPVNLVGYSPNVNRIWLERVRTVPNLASSGGVPVNLLTADPDFQPAHVYGPNSSHTSFTVVQGVIPQGTEVRSYIVHSYRSTATNQLYGTLTFQFPIIGVIALNTARSATYRWLRGTDSSFGLLPARTYPIPTSDYRSMDSFQPNDYISISSDLKTLTFSLQATASSYDEFRIFTATPEPAAVVLFGTVAVVLLGVLAARRRRATPGRGAEVEGP
jgi:hypothetical protein